MAYFELSLLIEIFSRHPQVHAAGPRGQCFAGWWSFVNGFAYQAAILVFCEPAYRARLKVTEDGWRSFWAIGECPVNCLGGWPLLSETRSSEFNVHEVIQFTLKFMCVCYPVYGSWPEAQTSLYLKELSGEDLEIKWLDIIRMLYRTLQVPVANGINYWQ